MKAMTNSETRAWVSVLIEVLKSDGSIWKELSSEQQGKYLVNWAKNHEKIRIYFKKQIDVK